MSESVEFVVSLFSSSSARFVAYLAALFKRSAMCRLVGPGRPDPSSVPVAFIAIAWAYARSEESRRRWMNLRLISISIFNNTEQILLVVASNILRRDGSFL